MSPPAKRLVVVPQTLPRPWLERLSQDSNLELHETIEDGTLPEAWAEAHGLLCLLTQHIDKATLAGAPKLRVVSNMAVGVDNVDVAACSARGIVVGHTPGVLTEATADLTFGLLLNAARRIQEAAADARAGRWTTWTPTGWLGTDLQDTTLGIVGLGKIGEAVARRARAFGMRVIHRSRTLRPERDRTLGVTAVSLAALFEQADFLSLHAPLTSDTRGMIDRTALRAMKPTCTLINTSRGPLVDASALQEALENSWIAGAALDVTDPEPLPADHLLYRLPNVLITPHIGSATTGTRRRMADLACQNLVAGVYGRRLPHCVNPKAAGETDPIP